MISNEAEFRELFIRPLLILMGFTDVTNQHGVSEFGKDYVFSEIHRMGHARHMVVQAKHEKTINKGEKVHEVLRQIKEAFSVPYFLPSSPREIRYVSAVYVFNTGDITSYAQTFIKHELEKERYGSNVYFFDGGKLEQLEKLTKYHIEQNVRSRLEALRNQLVFNIQVWIDLLKELEAEQPRWDIRGSILHGIEEFMTAPIFPEKISVNTIGGVWQCAKVISGITTKHYMLPIAEPSRSSDLDTLKSTVVKAIDRSTIAISQIQDVLNEYTY